ncbi:MAG: hypothetical protein PHP66_03085 [Syntrophales bacterium]|jgi:DNA invertase Pin-like site-specific DNA recombinase|nr:hypothetical protein [Syntrophales bacterium]
MKENTRIRFNPVTKEIEVEGSESFVKAYFNKLQGMVSGSAEKKAAAKKTGKKVKTLKAGSRRKAAKKAPRAKRVTNIDKVVGLIQTSAEGISTSELKKKTGLSDLQIWSIVNRTAKAGRIRKVKRGVYGGTAMT